MKYCTLFGLNLFYCNIITMGLGTNSKTSVDLFQYKNDIYVNNFHMQFFFVYYTFVAF